MKDVAIAAGVSQPAVSYAYNKPTQISEAQREHIFKVAKDLGYPGPNVRGRSLRSGRVGAIGLMIMDELPYAFSDPSTIGVLKGIAEFGELASIALSLFPLQKDFAEGGAESRSMSLAFRGLVDGLIVHCLPDNYPGIRVALKQGIPMVMVDAPVIKGMPFVGIDDFGSAKTQMKHLLELGHRRIAVMVDRLRPDGQKGLVSRRRIQESTEHVVSERISGYLTAAKAAGLTFDDLVVMEAGGFDYAQGRWAAEQLLEKRGITAVAATSDVMAISMLTTASNRGVSVPGQLSVVGFDDIPEAAGFGLTTIRQPLIEKGRVAAKMLHEMLNADAREAAEPKRIILPTELVVRTSTSAA
ncbi:LacI family DNA-binding transcriptional regulator [Ralstonia sp. VS2407]